MRFSATLWMGAGRHFRQPQVCPAPAALHLHGIDTLDSIGGRSLQVAEDQPAGARRVQAVNSMHCGACYAQQIWRLTIPQVCGLSEHAAWQVHPPWPAEQAMTLSTLGS